MIRFACLCLLALSILILPACKRPQGGSPGAATPEEQPKSGAGESVEPPKSNEGESEEHFKYSNDLIAGKSSLLSYNGYSIVKRKKKFLYKYPIEMQSKPDLIDVSYTVLKRNGKILAEFNEFYYGIGNSNDIGLFPFLGGTPKQLFITLAAPRSGRHFIVDLAVPFRVIFDSYDYAVGREEFWIKDLDRDGVYEVFLSDPSFYMVFERMSMAETPLPETIFKYDGRAKKYLPANHLFQAYALKGMEDDINQLKPEKELGYLSGRLRILLRYIYAGKEDEGWAFFDKEYHLEDKEEVRSKTKAVLRKNPFYRFVYRRTRTSTKAVPEGRT